MIRLSFIIAGLLLVASQFAAAQTFPAGFTPADLATGFSSPTCFCIAQDGSVYICQQAGVMRVWKEGVGLLPTNFATISTDSFFERGLIGVTADPDFLNNRYIYIYYTATTPTTHNRISRLTASANGETMVPGSEVALLDLNTLSAGNHNGGGIHFGPDGKLYAGVGENAVSSNSQSINTLLGKVLRINVTPGDVIPSDNPNNFPAIAGSPTGNNRAIWAVGLRNPFTLAFQPGTGRLFINDVGQSAWEEVNDGIAGRNYGWPTTEGPFNQGSFPNFTHPFYWYSNGSAICGGAFYNPPISTFPVSDPDSYYGDYFFGELSGRIDRIDVGSATATNFTPNPGSMVDVRVDALGRLLYLNRTSNKLVRVSYNTPFSPSFMSQPADRSVCAGQTIQLSVNIAGNPVPTIVWRKDGNDLSDGGNISGAATPTLRITNAQAFDAGQYEVFIQNTQGDKTSNPAIVNVYGPTPDNADIIQAFVNAILAQSTSVSDLCLFDFSGNGVVDLADVDGLVGILLPA